jgi:urease accessory protein
MQRSDGRLSLRFEYDAPTSRTLLHVAEQRQPLKVVRAFHVETSTALAHVHNLSGGVLSGDHLSLRLEIGEYARAQVTSTGATRLYRSRAGTGAAEFVAHVVVKRQGLLEYLPDPLIPFAGSRFHQKTAVDLADGGGLFWWGTVAPGREARGEVFSYDALQFRFDLRAAGTPITVENCYLHPPARSLESPARLGPFRYFSSFFICRAGAGENTWRSLEKQLLELAGQRSSPVIIWGLSRLPAHGLVVRALSRNGRDIASGLVDFWRVAKQALYGQDAVIPRKIY